MLFSLLVRTILAASLTRFPSFKGNRQHLESLVSLIGPLGSELPPDGSNLDSIIPLRDLVTVVKNLSEKQAMAFGELLGDLSPAGFDKLCFQLEGYNHLESLTNGYPHGEALWKRSRQLNFLTEPTVENAEYHPGFFPSHQMLINYCALMEQQPEKILTEDGLEACLNLWMEQGKFELVRKVSRDRSILRCGIAPAFEGYEREFLNLMLKVNQNDIDIPKTISPAQLSELRVKLRDTVPHRTWKLMIVTDDEAIKGLVDQINAEVIHLHYGFDSEPFEGELPLPPGYLEAQESDVLPAAFDLFYHYDYRLPLNRLLGLLKRADEILGDGQVLEKAFEDWLNVDFRLYSHRIKELFDIIVFQGGLARLPNLIPYSRWRYGPLFEAIRDGDYPGREKTWAEERLMVPTNIVEVPPFARMAMCLCYGDMNILQREKGIHYLLFYHFMTVETAPVLMKLGLTDKELMASLLKNTLPAIAWSAHTQLLDIYVKYVKPEIILSHCENPAMRQRLTLMMHLSPQVVSYNGTKKIDKNSTAFRDWTLLNLPCTAMHRVANLKLLHYYFYNRATLCYEPADLLSRDQNEVDWLIGLVRMNTPPVEIFKTVRLRPTFKPQSLVTRMRSLTI